MDWREWQCNPTIYIFPLIKLLCSMSLFWLQLTILIAKWLFLPRNSTDKARYSVCRYCLCLDRGWSFATSFTCPRKTWLKGLTLKSRSNFSGLSVFICRLGAVHLQVKFGQKHIWSWFKVCCDRQWGTCNLKSTWFQGWFCEQGKISISKVRSLCQINLGVFSGLEIKTGGGLFPGPKGSS